VNYVDAYTLKKKRFFRGSLRWSWCYIAPLSPVWFFSGVVNVLYMAPLMVLAPYDKDKCYMALKVVPLC